MIFKEVALTALSDFRKLILRYVANKKEAEQLLKRMDVARPRKHDNDAELMVTLMKIRAWLHEQIQTHPTSYYSYSGIEQYKLYLDEFLSQYRVVSNRVIHKAQKASSAMLNIIQISGMPKASLDNQAMRKIIHYCRELVIFGSREQIMQIHALLNTKCEDFADFFVQVLQDFLSFQKKQTLNRQEAEAA